MTDTFKVNSRLTLDYGLRWDYFTATTFEDGLLYNWDPTANAVIVPDAVRQKVSPLYPSNIKLVTGNVAPAPDKRNFAPRLSAAYRLTNSTVLRVGYGIFTFNGIQNGRPLFQFPNPFPTAGATATVPSQSISGYPTETKDGYIHQFNFTVEQEVRNMGFRLSYIGSRDRDLNYNLSINKPQPSLIPFTAARRPYQPFVGATFAQTNGKTNYDSLTFETKRNVGWVTFDAHWTWSNNMSNLLDLENPYSPNFWNRDFTARHRVVFNTLWDLPFGRGKRFLSSAPGAVNHVIGGWKLAWLGYLQTGQYFSPGFSGADPSNTNTSGGLPDRIANGNFSTGQRSLDRWFDVGAFARPPQGRFGNSGVNVLQGPGLNTQNLSISKRFLLTERFHLDYMTMISNLFNHPNFDFPNSNISATGQTGVIVSQQGFFSNEKAGPRLIEMRLRLEF
ncbi:MAG: TonB-dependent receptor [Acidobacteria bacterium]|nr:TonB-dependent receptor [Acidobacteriota bacterium]